MHNLYDTNWGHLLTDVLDGARPFHPLLEQICSTCSMTPLATDLKHATVVSHISALGSCMNKVSVVPVSKNPLVARWIISGRSLSPPQHSLVPP